MTVIPDAFKREERIASAAYLSVTLDNITDVLVEIPNDWLDEEDVERLKAVRKELEDMLWKYADRYDHDLKEAVAKSCCYDYGIALGE